MKRRLGWIAGGFGLLALVRGLARRRRSTEDERPIAYAPESVPVREPEPEVSPAEQPAEPDPRAEELRAKLDEAKAAGSDREEFESGETPVDAAEGAVDLETRRRAVHDEARSAIEEMRGGGPGEPAA